jgi:hypothetical protein
MSQRNGQQLLKQLYETRSRRPNTRTTTHTRTTERKLRKQFRALSGTHPGPLNHQSTLLKPKLGPVQRANGVIAVPRVHHIHKRKA